MLANDEIEGEDDGMIPAFLFATGIENSAPTTAITCR
jgi:hypothetical protein